MNYDTLLDLVTDLGYRLSMSGAETFRVEESINRILTAYGVQAEAYSIPNCLIVSLETPEAITMTRMRRIGFHGNDLDAVEKYNALSRLICTTCPDPEVGQQWMKQCDENLVHYPFRAILLGSFLGGFGFCFLFGGTLIDAIVAGFCGILIGLADRFMTKLNTNQFFKTITEAFIMSVPAYALGSFGLINNADASIIGTLMLLVPGLLFVNAMRDIIYGDTNSGVNRIIQVLFIAAAICLGTATAWNFSTAIFGLPMDLPVVTHSLLVQCIGCFLGCMGFSLLFNIRGPGMLLCIAGGVLTWFVYSSILNLGFGDLIAYFWATVIAAGYAEIMARVRKCPAIAYLVVSVFPLIPGAGVYYTMNHAVLGDMVSFADRGIHTIAIAGIMAVSMLIVSTTVRLWNVWSSRKIK